MAVLDGQARPHASSTPIGRLCIGRGKDVGIAVGLHTYVAAYPAENVHTIGIHTGHIRTKRPARRRRQW